MVRPCFPRWTSRSVPKRERRSCGRTSAWTGGPTFWADQVGLDVIVAGLQTHADRLTDFRLSTLLQDKAAQGVRFNG